MSDNQSLNKLDAYRERVGEDSFRTWEMIDIFAAAGCQAVVQHRINLFPNFTPDPVYRLLAPLEPRVEASRLWNALRTVNLFGLTRG